MMHLFRSKQQVIRFHFHNVKMRKFIHIPLPSQQALKILNKHRKFSLGHGFAAHNE